MYKQKIIPQYNDLGVYLNILASIYFSFQNLVKYNDAYIFNQQQNNTLGSLDLDSKNQDTCILEIPNTTSLGKLCILDCMCK